MLSVELLSRGAGGQTIGTLVRFRDPETRKQLESHLDLSSRLAAISRLTSGVAHEIKNPLNAIALHIEVLRTRMDAPEPELDLITREVRRLDHVVRTFLNFNKPLELETDRHESAGPGPRDRRFHRAGRGSTAYSGGNGAFPGCVDSGRFQAAASGDPNVVVNAIDAMDQQGRLRLEVESRDGECVLTVSDTGPGIPEEIRDRIFDLYFSTKRDGSGIGLALAFRMMQLHGGTIEFDSEPGKGTSFRLRFPEAAHAGRQTACHVPGTFLRADFSMTAHTNRALLIALCVAIACCSCQRKKPPVPVMVPPAVTVEVPAKPPPAPPPPPDLPPSQTGTAATPPPPVPAAKMPGPPRRKQRTAKKTHKPDNAEAQSADTQAAAPGTQTPSSQDAAQAPAPQLGQMLTDDQRRDYETHIHDALERAQANLRKARSNPRLTAAQQRIATQVETFVAQAEERRKTDLVSSRSLAERADLLARDLADSLQ